MNLPNLPNEYWTLVQREMQNRSSARSRRIGLLNTITTQHFTTMQTILRLLEMEIRNEHELALPSSTTSATTISANRTTTPSARTSTSQSTPQMPSQRQSRTTFFSPIYSDIRVLNTAENARTTGFTADQINQITELLPYDASMNETRCPITWTNFTEGQDVLQIRSCGHVFGPDALRTWLQQNRRCPICRINPLSLSSSSANISPSSSSSTISNANTSPQNTNTSSLENVLDTWLETTTRSLANGDSDSVMQYEYTMDLSDILSAALRGRR